LHAVQSGEGSTHCCWIGRFTSAMSPQQARFTSDMVPSNHLQNDSKTCSLINQLFRMLVSK